MRRATAKANETFIDVMTVSGYRIGVADPAGKHHHLPADASDETLGVAVLDALQASRFLTPEETSALRTGADSHYDEWVAAAMDQHAYKSRRAMFRNMRSCRLEQDGTTITIIPSRHEKLEGWSGDGIGVEDQVIVESTQQPARVGAALREAFERCM